MSLREVFIVDGKRTPQAKSGMDLKEVPVPHLGDYLLTHLVDEAGIPKDEIDEVIIGNTGAPPNFPNIARVIALYAGLDKKTSAYTVHRNCASGMEAVSQGFIKIASGRSEVIACGGVENMSQMPLIYSKQMTDLFIDLMKAKSLGKKIEAMSKFRPAFLAPIIAVQQGLTDPFCNVNMGMTAEYLAREFGITRKEQDEYANESHRRAVHATEEGLFKDEILPLIFGKNLNKILDKDIGPRANSTVEGLGKMRPFFDKKTGTVTVGNSCPITDGGSMMLLASKEAVEKYNLDPIAKMVDFHFHGLEPERMGMGPLLAMNGVFERTGLGVKDMDLFEINEAFATQILAVNKAMADSKHSSRYGIDKTLGEIPLDKLNILGGGVALGHPVGSTGSRIVITLMHALKRAKAKYGVASLCIGGGQGGAVLIENLKK